LLDTATRPSHALGFMTDIDDKEGPRRRGEERKKMTMNGNGEVPFDDPTRPTAESPTRAKEVDVAVVDPVDTDTGKTSIGRLASDLGVSSRTIRYYEEIGILPPPPRSPGGTRIYSPEYRFYIEGALALKEMGFSLDEIKLIGQLALQRPMSKKQQVQALDVVHDKMAVLEHKINVLNRLRDILHETEKDIPLITRLFGEDGQIPTDGKVREFIEGNPRGNGNGNGNGNGRAAGKAKKPRG